MEKLVLITANKISGNKNKWNALNIHKYVMNIHFVLNDPPPDIYL